jgi:phosphate starvation-inducible PhoH-like protein
LRILERELGVDARARGNEVRLVGAAEKIELARKVLEELYGVVRAGSEVNARDVRQAVRMVTQQPDVDLEAVYEDILSSVGGRRRIAAKNLNQRRYIEAMQSCDVVFAVGPAGTGKTYLAMAMAIASLNRHEVSRVVLTRPAVEAGEKLGFLPGSMAEKVNPYLRPLYDALNDQPADGARHHRGSSAGLHAGPHPQRFVRHSRRGSEHDQRTDEDAAHTDRLRFQGGHYR